MKIDEMPSWEMMQNLDDPPTSDELVAAMDKMKWGKAGGRLEEGLVFCLN